MKLYANKQVYLQNFDLAYMFREQKRIPDFIIEEIEGQLPYGTTRIGLTDDFDFAWVFKTLASIDWLMECGYILNFDELNYSTMRQLEKIQMDAFDAWSAAENCTEYSELISATETVLEPTDFNQIIYSVQAMMGYKTGVIDFPNLPEEYDQGYCEETEYYPRDEYYYPEDEYYPPEGYYQEAHRHNERETIRRFPAGKLHRRLENCRLRRF